MAIITISRGSYSMGKRVAELAADRLGYSLISREVLLEASHQFNIPEIKLEKAIHDAPGILERYSHKKQTYVAFIRSALVEKVLQNDIIYHGLAGHLLLKGVEHVLKVRITTSMENRVAYVMAQEGISAHDAEVRIQKDDQERRKWTRDLYGEDPWDSSLYDLTIRIDKLTIDQAVDFICQAANNEGFSTSEKSLQQLKDLSIACYVKAELVQDAPDIGVSCEYGNVLIYIKSREHLSGKLTRRIEEMRHGKKEIFNIEVHTGSLVPKNSV